MVERARKTKLNSRLTREYQCLIVSVHNDYHDRKNPPTRSEIDSCQFWDSCLLSFISNQFISANRSGHFAMYDVPVKIMDEDKDLHDSVTNKITA